jgi:hypothetical protein
MKTLQQLNKDLIQLLNQRSALLARSHDSSLPAETSQCLIKTGLPEFVWESLATCCAAATVAPIPPA